MKCNRCDETLTETGYQIHLAWCKGIDYTKLLNYQGPIFMKSKHYQEFPE